MRAERERLLLELLIEYSKTYDLQYLPDLKVAELVDDLQNPELNGVTE